MSDTMFCSVVCIFTPSHCCDVRYDVLFCLLYLHTFTLLWCPIRCSVPDITIVWRCEDTKDRTEHRIGHHNSVKPLHTVVMSDTMFCSIFCIFTPSHYCDVRYDVLLCLLYLHTFTLLWCPIRCSVLIRHHNSVKVWRYKRQNRTSYQTSQ
jgi:hypothetical protein